MTEDFIHYLWKERLFDDTNLFSDEGFPVVIVNPGTHNKNAGPDFFNAQIEINGTYWAGNVEIHLLTSDWKRHNHHTDVAYDNCILHIVYINDDITCRTNGTRIPVVALKNRFDPGLWDGYLALLSSEGWIPCQKLISSCRIEIVFDFLQLMIKERIGKRISQILIANTGNKGDWEETFYQALSRNFGFQVNAVPFEMLARSLPLKIIRKESYSRLNIEALLFGQAGILPDDFTDPYVRSLEKNYSFLSQKYSLTPINNSTWKYLRLRPVNFPAVRLAQFSDLLSKRNTSFHSLIELSSLEEIISVFEVQSSGYWDLHYHFNTPSGFKIKKMGIESINNILINTLIPFLFAFGKFTGDTEYENRATHFLRSLPGEDNNIIRKWKSIGIASKTAEDSQALVHLKTIYCSNKRCLSCGIGNNLITMKL